MRPQTHKSSNSEVERWKELKVKKVFSSFLVIYDVANTLIPCMSRVLCSGIPRDR